MGRGKIEIKKIENPTNRQVTYSKRRNGIFKKAHELSVLCDAKVSLIMFSASDKFHEYTSPSISTKSIFDDYQEATGIDLWITHYERMQEHLRKLKEINNRLRREIRQRMGEDLQSLGMYELRSLEQAMAESLTTIRERKYHVIKTSTDTYRKKVKSLERSLLIRFVSILNPSHNGDLPQLCPAMVEDIRALARMMGTSICHTSRQANQCADGLARFGANQEENLTVTYDISAHIIQLVLEDILRGGGLLD